MMPHRTALFVTSSLLPILLAGCGGAVSSGGAGPAAAHGGTLLELPDGAGHVELMVEKADAKATGRRVTGKVAAFFTARDGKSPLEPAPADVLFTDEDGKRHPLAATPGDPSVARFESEPFPIAPGEPTGTIEARIGGQTVRLQNRPR